MLIARVVSRQPTHPNTAVLVTQCSDHEITHNVNLETFSFLLAGALTGSNHSRTEPTVSLYLQKPQVQSNWTL